MVIHGDLADVSSLARSRADIMLSLVRLHNSDISHLNLVVPIISIICWFAQYETAYWSAEFLILFLCLSSFQCFSSQVKWLAAPHEVRLSDTSFVC